MAIAMQGNRNQKALLGALDSLKDSLGTILTRASSISLSVEDYLITLEMDYETGVISALLEECSGPLFKVTAFRPEKALRLLSDCIFNADTILDSEG